MDDQARGQPAGGALLDCLAALEGAHTRIAELEHRIDALHRLAEVSLWLNSTWDLHDLLGRIMRAAQEVLLAGASSLLLVDRERNRLVFEVATGSAGRTLEQRFFPIDRGIAGWVVANNKPALVPDVQQDERFFGEIDRRSGFHTRSLLAVPVRIRGEVVGVLEALNRLGGTFTELDQESALMLAAQAGVALENARLYQEVARGLMAGQTAPY